MEGIVRQVRTKQLLCDVGVTHFVNPGMLKQIQGGKTPLSIEAHEDVLKHYRVPSLYLARGGRSIRRLDMGRSGTHPKPAGNAVARELIAACWSRLGQAPSRKRRQGRRIAADQPIDTASFFNGRFLSPGLAKRSDGWKCMCRTGKTSPAAYEVLLPE